MEQIITTKDLMFEYQAQLPEETNTRVLNQINLSIRKGEFLAILGHNGSVKSTPGQTLQRRAQTDGGQGRG